MIRKDKLEGFKRILEEHLIAINGNTSEIQGVFDYLHEIEIKLDKFSQRVDQLQLNQGGEVEKPIVSPLNQTEKKVFLVLYTEGESLTYNEISAKSGLPTVLISENISSLVVKGIPVIRSFFNNQLFVKIDPVFKERQAKENLVNLSLESFMG